MSTTIKEAIAVETLRKAVHSWTREDGYRVKIMTKHDKNSKRYVTYISECVARKREGYTMERHIVFSDLYRVLNSEVTARYNFNKLQAIHAEIAAAMIQDVENLLATHAPIDKEEE